MPAELLPENDNDILTPQLKGILVTPFVNKNEDFIFILIKKSFHRVSCSSHEPQGRPYLLLVSV